jgi:hypothetical protein
LTINLLVNGFRKAVPFGIAFRFLKDYFAQVYMFLDIAGNLVENSRSIYVNKRIMKRIFLLSLLLTGLQVRAQFIQQISVVPPTPTINDQVMVLVDAGFASGTCEENSQMGGFTTATRYEASTLHCIGMLTYICYDTDTFYLGTLAAGNYRFLVSVDAGGQPSPCTPGIVPGAIDSIDFTVSSGTGLIEDNQNDIVVGPNPASEIIRIGGNNLDAGGFFVFIDVRGKLVHKVQAITADVNVSNLSSGLYFVRYLSEKGMSRTARFVKH